MYYAKINVKTNNGWISKFAKYTEAWKFGRYLLRYYAEKEYDWKELTEEDLKIIKLSIGKSKFDKIKWITVN